MRRCGCGPGLRRAAGRREDSACSSGRRDKSSRVDLTESYGTPYAKSSDTRLCALTSLGREKFLPTPRKPTATPSINPTGRLVHKVPCEFKFETQATHLSEGMHTGTLAVSGFAEETRGSPHPRHRRDGKENYYYLRMAHGLHRLCPDL